MVNQLPLKIVRPVDLLPEDPMLEFEAALKAYEVLMANQPKNHGVLKWGNPTVGANAASYWSAHTIKPSKDLNWQSLKARSFALLYGSAPRKLIGMGNHDARLSGRTLAGTLPKAKRNGKKSKRK